MKLILLALLFPLPLSAFCLVPVAHDGSVQIARAEAAIFHRAASDGQPGYQEMILRVTPEFAAEPAARLAWIIPLPATPLEYSESSAAALYSASGLHSHLYSLARDQWSRRTNYIWPESLSWLKKREEAESSAPQSTIALELAAPSLMQIAANADELAELLQQRGYPVPELGWFAEHSFCFLCVWITPREGQDRLGPAVEFAPVRVAFESNDVFVPIVAGAGQPQGAIDLAFVTDRPLSTWPYELVRHEVRARSAGYVNLFNLWSVKPLPEDIALALNPRASQPAERWYANRIESAGMPAAEGLPSAEFSIAVGGLDDELPGFWYYADQDITFMERFFREHLLAMTTSFFFLGVLFLVLKGRQRRREMEQRANAVTRRTAQ
jgi:hypothetical protein